ncbi:MAG: indole-3-glycerol phosphate synthase TrpC [Syntrophomonadaceae bacterium]|jgi:indole-3-glycerol phosphate synthase
MLDSIVAQKHKEIATLMDKFSTLPLKGSSAFNPFSLKGEPVSIIAEVKKASPSRGVLCEDFNPVNLAISYEQNGAALVSVITDEKFFNGSPQTLAEVKAAVSIPVLRKDFILHSCQLYQTSELGADAVLLIAALHNYERLLQLVETCNLLGLHPLLEIHDRNELGLLRDLPIQMVGINNRNLKDFSVDLQTSLKLVEHLPDSYVKISESGISNAEQISLLSRAGFDALLIGEGLVTSSNPGNKLRELLKSREVIHDQSKDMRN